MYLFDGKQCIREYLLNGLDDYGLERCHQTMLFATLFDSFGNCADEWTYAGYHSLGGSGQDWWHKVWGGLGYSEGAHECIRVSYIIQIQEGVCGEHS